MELANTVGRGTTGAVGEDEQPITSALTVRIGGTTLRLYTWTPS
jgi:hypothetical protein